MVFKRIHRLGVKLVGGAKRFGSKHKGKIAVVGAVAGAGAFVSGAEDRVKTRAGERAKDIMNVLDDEAQAEAQQQHDNLMKEKAIPQPKSGFAPKPAKDPGLIQTAKNIPGALKQAEKSGEDIQSAKVLKKGKALQQAGVDILGAVNKPSKKEQKRVSEEQRFIDGLMSEKEAQAFIKKQGGKKVAKRSKKAEKQSKKRKKKKKK